MMPDARSLALSNLQQALAALAPHLQGPGEAAVLDRLMAEAARLSQSTDGTVPGLRVFDRARFHHLIDLAGPSMAADLITHLVQDLERCRATAKADDLDALRVSSHVLISLAGSVGAVSLHGMAETLNAAAHRQDDAAIAAVLPAFLAELDALIALVRATPAPAGSGSSKTGDAA